MRRLCYFFIFILVATSCNVLKTITGGETKVEDGFGDFFDGPGHGYIFIGKSGSLQIVRTSDNAIFTDTGFVNPDLFTSVEGKIYFRNNTSELYRIENEGIQTHISGITALDSMTEFEERLYFVAYNGADTQLNTIDNNNNSFSVIGSSYNGGSNKWIFGDYVNGKLVSCYDSAPLAYWEVNKTTGTRALISGTACGSEPTAYYHDGKFLRFDGSFNIVRYDVGTDTTDSIPGGAAPTPIMISHHGNFYFQDGGQLFSVNANDTTLTKRTIVSSGYSPTNVGTLLEAPDRLFFTNTISGVEQIMEYEFSSNSINQVSNFTSHDPIAFLTAAGNGFYFVTGSSINFLSFNGELETIGSVEGGSVIEIKFFRENEISF